MNRISKVLGIISFGILLGLGQIVSAGLFSLILIYFIIGFLLWKFSKEKERNFILTLYISGLLLRIALSVIFYFHSVSIGGSGFLSGDALVYSDRGWEISQFWLNPHENSFPDLKYGINGYTYFIAFIYYFFGHSLLLVKLINSLFGILSGVAIYYLSKHLFKEKIARLSAIFVVFSPSLIRWSIDSLKDPMLILLLILFFGVLMIFQRRKWVYLAPLVCIVLILETMDNPLYIICSIVLGFVFFLILRIKLLIKVALILLILLGILFFYPENIKIRDQAQEYLEKAAYHQRFQATDDDAGYIIYDDAIFEGGEISLFSVFWSYIKGLSYALFSPFPWAISSQLQLFAYPQIIIWYLLFPFTVLGILLSLRYKIKVTSPIILFIFLIISLLALAEGNIGGVFRHRDWVSPFFLIFAATGLVWVFEGRKDKTWA